MRVIKLPQAGLELARLLTTMHKLVCFDFTSLVDIDCARSSLCQARQLSGENIGTEIRGSWVRVPRETDFISRIEKPQYNIEYHIYIYIYMTMAFKKNKVMHHHLYSRFHDLITTVEVNQR